MNYRHAFHAGNFADVHKHTALVAILAHLQKKDAPYCVIDTHAGRGLYDLSSAEALRTGEAAQGIGRVAAENPATQALAAYLRIVREFGPGRYPGSPMITAKLLRPQDRLVAFETHRNEFEALRDSLAPFDRARAVQGDGYAQLQAVLPPPERRGLILIDPPYEAATEPGEVVRAVGAAMERFATGIYLIWYPRKAAALAEALAGEVRSRTAAKLLSLTLEVGNDGTEPYGRLSASTLLVVNPPYRLDTQMLSAQSELLQLLKRGTDARAEVKWLADGA